MLFTFLLYNYPKYDKLLINAISLQHGRHGHIILHAFNNLAKTRYIRFRLELKMILTSSIVEDAD